MSDYNKIIELAIQNNNIFKTKMVVDAGIRKERIREMLESGEIKKISHGYYSLKDSFVDQFYSLQQRHSTGIFSYGTAAYLCGIVKKAPKTIDYTVPRGYNTSKLNIDDKLKYHYVLEPLYDIGLVEIVSPEGELVRVYDKERTICDFIRHRNRMDSKLYSEVLNAYFRSKDMDVKKLLRYGKIFRISKELQMYMKVL